MEGVASADALRPELAEVTMPYAAILYSRGSKLPLVGVASLVADEGLLTGLARLLRPCVASRRRRRSSGNGQS
jgi:hypothetical protein